MALLEELRKLSAHAGIIHCFACIALCPALAFHTLHTLLKQVDVLIRYYSKFSHDISKTLGWFQWVALPPSPVAVAPACWAVPPVGGDVEACTGSRGSARPDRAVPPTLEPDRAVAPRRYHPHYRPPLEPMGGSTLSTPDWSV
jgi:hypothetical protein